MSRKSVFVGLGIVGLLAGLALILVLMIRHEPDFYTRAATTPGPECKVRSKEFNNTFMILVNQILSYREGGVEFTQEQINSYLAEDFVRSGLAKRYLPEGISAPRIAITPDKIQLGFRYRLGPWSTVLEVDFRLWLAGKEPNVVALEIQGYKAGALPISAQSILEKVSDGVPQDLEVSWYRYNGNPVALLRFQADRKRPTMQLKNLELHEGRLVIAGAPLDGVLPRAMLTP